VTTLRILLALTISTLFTAGTAFACSPPSQPGAVLCYPTSNASVVPILNIEGAAKGNNSPIVAMILYADNQKIYQVEWQFVPGIDDVQHRNQHQHNLRDMQHASDGGESLRAGE
jgi:hypothetical protein